MTSPLLRTSEFTAGYQQRVGVLHDVSIEVQAGEIVTVLGANGAGKTTLLNGLMNQLAWTQGDVFFDGRSTRGRGTHTLVHDGLVLVPETRALLPFMSIRENLQFGIDIGSEVDRVATLGLDDVFDLFDVLRVRQNQKAGSLSGGEQQMLAIGRALLTAPRCLLLDEPSQGLAPKLVIGVFAAIAEAVRRSAISLVLVEQNVQVALELAERCYLLQRGRIVFDGAADELRGSERIKDVYLA